ncbi:MAG: substrate-binding domain-containing protein [Ruminococcus sp.]|jgi:phosphate transport system substrate-binding protein|nr:substrate-binding domain-containing protein [Ruminococcus sp.]
MKAIKFAAVVLSAVMMFTACGKTNNSTVAVITREDGSGTRSTFTEMFEITAKGDDGTVTDNTTLEATVANQTEVVITNVSGNKNAIGYISLGSLNDTVKAVNIDGVSADTTNVKSGEYKAAREFFIATQKSDVRNQISEDFINFILSAEGQAVVGKSYITVSDNAAPYAGEKPAGKITVAGSSSVYPVMEKLKEAYLAVNPNAEIEIQMSDSSSGLSNATEGLCDIAMSSRKLKDAELEKLDPTTIAIDAIVVIVNKENEVSNLTSDEINGIFTGKITDWSVTRQD